MGQWLFEGKETETCALCGRQFAVVALVTAHKKRRADCNEGERRDPHIVMPLCQFGCDYLYERQHIYVEEGIVRRGVPLQSGGVEDAHAHELVGRQLEERWLEGNPLTSIGPRMKVASSSQTWAARHRHQHFVDWINGQP